MGHSADFKHDGSRSLGEPRFVAKRSPDDHIAVGRILGKQSADMLLGQRLFIGGNLN